MGDRHAACLQFGVQIKPYFTLNVSQAAHHKTT